MVAITYNLHDNTSSPNGTDTAASIPLQAIALDLPLHASKALIRDIRAGKGALVEFGRQPELRCGKQTFSLKATSSRYPNDIYRRKARGSNDYELLGSIHHDLSLVEAEKSSAAMDAAVAQLKNSLAFYQQEKDANKTTILSATPNVPGVHGKKPSTSTKKLFPVSKKAARLKGAATQRLNTSQASTGSKISQSSPSLNHQSLSADVHKALRFVLLHLLAIKSLSLKAIIQQTRSNREDCLDVLRKIGKQASPTTDEWQLTEKAYKELDVWAFRYPSQELRQTVIDNAIRVYDRLRISPEDQQWQILLPKHDRGKGVILSKLKLNVQPTRPPRKPTPITKSGKRQVPQKKSDKVLAREDDPTTSAADEKTDLFDETDEGLAVEQVDVSAPEKGSKTVAPEEYQSSSRDSKTEKKITAEGHGSNKPKAETKAVAGTRKIAVNAEKKGKLSDQPTRLDSGKDSSTSKEKKAGEAISRKEGAKKEDESKAKSPLKPAKEKSAQPTKSPKLADKRSEKRPTEDAKAKSSANERPSHQKSPGGKLSSSSETTKKPDAAATPKPFTTHWQPRKDPPVIRKGPKNPASRRPSQGPAEKSVTTNNASQDKDSVRRSSTKPKIPSPLGAEPMVNTPAATPMTKSPVPQSIRKSAGNSDASLKRKANDLDAKDNNSLGTGGNTQKHRKTNDSTSSLSSLSSQATHPSAGKSSVSAGINSGEKTLKRKSAPFDADDMMKSPSKQRRLETDTDTSRKAGTSDLAGTRKSVGSNSHAPGRVVAGSKPAPKAISKGSTTTAASSGQKVSKTANANAASNFGSGVHAERTADQNSADNPRARHGSSNSTSTVSSTVSDSNTSNVTSVSATAPALTSASTSASNSDAEEGKPGASPLRMSFRQTVEHARKFQQYYVPYAELYERLSSSPDPPSEKDRATLMGMHEKLSVMKMEIKSGALRRKEI